METLLDPSPLYVIVQGEARLGLQWIEKYNHVSMVEHHSFSDTNIEHTVKYNMSFKHHSGL